MNPFGHVVVGVDGSSGSETALRWSVAQAPEQLTLVHGFSPGIELLAASAQISLDGVRAEHDRLLSTTWSEAARKSQADAATVLVDDNPAAALAHTAAARDADLIVIGHQGHGQWNMHHVGETAGRLLHRCDVPLILTNETTEPEEVAGPVVVALSRPTATDNAELQWAIEVAARRNVPLKLVSLVEPLAFIDARYVVDMAQLHEAMQSQLTALTDTLRSQHPLLDISAEVRNGPVLEELSTTAAQSHASLVVVGSHHPGAVAGFIAGSVARFLPPRLDCPMAAIPHLG